MAEKAKFHWILMGVGAGLIVLGLLFHFAIVRPARSTFEKKAAENQEVSKKLLAKRADVAKLDNIDSHLQNASKVEAATFEKRLPRVDDGFSNLIQFFSDTASRIGVQKGRVNFKNNQRPDSGLLEVRINLPVEGGYTDIVKFINALERSDQLLIIDSIALQSGLENPNVGRLSLSLVTYMKPI